MDHKFWRKIILAHGAFFGIKGHHFLAYNSKTKDFWEIWRTKSVGQKTTKNPFLGSNYSFLAVRTIFLNCWSGHFSRFFELWGRFSRDFPIGLENVLTRTKAYFWCLIDWKSLKPIWEKSCRGCIYNGEQRPSW